MAYPFGRPTTLILLQSPAVAGDELCIAAIERGERGSIKLQLSGTAYDDWVEWHPGQSRPTSFVDGLSASRELKQVTALHSGWDLVRYRSFQSQEIAVKDFDPPLASAGACLRGMMITTRIK